MKTILIADDLPAHLDLFEVILQRADCRLVRAEEGIAALRIAREVRPDLIYLDFEMPGINGAEICRLLKADPDRRDVPVVLFSSHQRRDDAMHEIEPFAEEVPEPVAREPEGARD